MALSQYYEDRFAGGIQWSDGAISEAIGLGKGAWDQEKYTSALFWAGHAMIMAEILDSFKKTRDACRARGLTALMSIQEQSRIANMVMRNVVNPRVDNISIPKSSGPASPATYYWNDQRAFLKGILTAGRWRGARDFYDNVMGTMGWAHWNPGGDIPFWGDLINRATNPGKFDYYFVSPP